MRKLLLISFVLAASTLQAEEIDLESYLKRLESSNKNIQAQREKIKYAYLSKDKVGLFPDPMLQIGRENFQLMKTKTEDSMSEVKTVEPSPAWSFGISQEIPWPGNNGRKEEAANLNVSKAELEFSYSLLNQKYDAIQEYIDLVTLDKIHKLTVNLLRENERTLQLIESRHEQSFASHSELFQIQTEIEFSKSEIQRMKNDIEIKSKKMLNAANVEDLNSKFKMEIQDKYLNINSKIIDRNAENYDISEQILSVSQDKKIADLSVARNDYKPSLNVQLSMMKPDEGMNMYNAMIGIKIPFSGIRVANIVNNMEETNDKIYKEELGDYQLKKKLALSLSKIRLNQSVANVKTLKEKILPLAEQHQKILLADFAQGEVSLSELILLNRNILQFKVALAKSYQNLISEKINSEKIELGLDLNSLDEMTPILDLGAMAGNNSMSYGKMKSKSMGGNKRNKSPVNTQQNSTPNSTDDSEEDMKPSGGGMSGM